MDQAVISLGTFLTNIILVRSLPLAEYGAYALVAGVLLFLHGFPAALVVYPMSVRGAESDAAGLRRLAGGSLALVAALALPLGAAAVGATWLVGRPELALFALAAMLLWQVQETLRRALLAHLRHGEAIWGDALSYLGQAALVAALAYAGRLSVEGAFAVMALTSGTAAALQAVQLGLRTVTVPQARRLGGEFFRLGRWAALTSLLAAVTLQGLPWTIAAVHGLEAVAEYEVVANMLRPAHPVMQAVGNLIIPAAAWAAARGGDGAARRAAWVYGLQGVVVLVPYFLIVATWPGKALEAFYGTGRPYASLDAAVRLFVAAYIFAYLASALEALLNGLKRSRSAFFGHVPVAIALLVVGIPTVAWGGVRGAAMTVVLMNLVRVAAFAAALRARPSPGAPIARESELAVRSR